MEQNNKICQNCKFWGNGIDSILRNLHRQQDKSLEKYKIEIELFNNRKIDECQKISNATIVPLSFQIGNETVYKKTDYNFKCELYEKNENEFAILKMDFGKWMNIKYPNKRITQVSNELRFFCSLNDLLPFSILNPLTWKNYKFNKGIRYLVNNNENFTSKNIFKHKITEEEFEKQLSQCVVTEK